MDEEGNVRIVKLGISVQLRDHSGHVGDGFLRTKKMQAKKLSSTSKAGRCQSIDVLKVFTWFSRVLPSSPSPEDRSI